MKYEFKVGDKIMMKEDCWPRGDGPLKGKTYTLINHKRQVWIRTEEGKFCNCMDLWKLIREKKMKFKKGDKVRVADWASSNFKGGIDFVEDPNYDSNFPATIKLKNGFCVNPSEIQLIKEATMDLRARIEALEGWDKEADDILNDTGLEYSFDIYCKDDKKRWQIYLWKDNNIEGSECFYFATQCDKLQAFKKALLWLAEKAGKLEDKDKIKAEIREMRKRLIDLERKL
ncbi:MAG TPA: hypothetical protein ENI13_01455 [candidate division CPR3 bacterium]|uniref:Uncharacterized protein n=1 Tax=candidate division CPR3 bacterium TaxID=2268181 RepID=A0A7C1NZK3_UNCC3|nr:hypothetical protein [candidate division CPR3 bacterium]